MALGYQQLQRVEQAWRQMKSGLGLRPVYHRAERRIRAHIALTVLALLLERMAEHALEDTWRNIRHDLAGIKLVQLFGPNGTLWQITEPRARVLVLGAAVLLGPVPSHAQDAPSSGAARPVTGLDLLESALENADRLGLTSEQRAQIEELRVLAEERTGPARERIEGWRAQAAEIGEAMQVLRAERRAILEEFSSTVTAQRMRELQRLGREGGRVSFRGEARFRARGGARTFGNRRGMIRARPFRRGPARHFAPFAIWDFAADSAESRPNVVASWPVSSTAELRAELRNNVETAYKSEPTGPRSPSRVDSLTEGPPAFGGLSVGSSSCYPSGAL